VATPVNKTLNFAENISNQSMTVMPHFMTERRLMMIQEVRQKALNIELDEQSWIIDDKSVHDLGLYKPVKTGPTPAQQQAASPLNSLWTQLMSLQGVGQEEDSSTLLITPLPVSAYFMNLQTNEKHPFLRASLTVTPNLRDP